VSASLFTEEQGPIQVPALSAQPGLVHGFSTRRGGVTRCYRPDLPATQGDLNLGFTKDDDREHVRANRLRFLASLGADDFRHFGLLLQQHTPTVHVLRSFADAATDFTEPAHVPGDGLITNVPGLLLTVQVADCIPVLVFDPAQRAVGAFHAGWRGTVAGIAAIGVAAMREAYGSDPANMLAAIGPGIGPRSYVVGDAVREAFTANFAYADALFDTETRLNLWEANRRQLLDAGLAAEHVTVLGEDTATQTDRFFSHRAEDGFTGRMMAAIGLSR
jgi:YfiH family protein